MPEMQAQMSSLEERLRAKVHPDAGVPEREGERPSPVLEPQHAANIHNRRREVDMVRIYYGAESKISLPYAYLATVDMPEPGRLVLEFASRTVTIEGVRLEGLMAEIEARHAAMIRASDQPVFDTGAATHITRVTVKKPE